MSSVLQVHYGVPQGSVSGSILFNIYVNDLTEEIKDSFLIQYADDTQCLQTGTTDSLPKLIHNTEQTLTKINKLISKIPENTTIRAGEAFIHPSRSVKNLRLHFDNYMSFDVHVTEMSKNVSGTLMYINRIQDLLGK